MTVTKRQQLKWLAKRFDSLPFDGDIIVMSDEVLGYLGHEHEITNQELKRERDKMSSKPAVDNSWFERGELPPVGVPVELWWGGSFAYNCELITRREHHYVMWNLDADRPDCADYMNSEFRKLRTEREKAIDEIAELIAKSVYGSAKCQAEKLYDAGYRKEKAK